MTAGVIIETPPAGRRWSKEVVWWTVVEAVLLLVLLPPSVAKGVSEANNVRVLPLETIVFVGVGIKLVDILPVVFAVAVAVADAVLLPLSSRTIKESNSGNHRGQGHAVVNVERNRKIIEYNCRFREAGIV